MSNETKAFTRGFNFETHLCIPVAEAQEELEELIGYFELMRRDFPEIVKQMPFKDLEAWARALLATLSKDEK